MFKQPAENTNATLGEEKRSAERVNPITNPEELQLEIEAEAKRLAVTRGGDESYSDEEWQHATRIVQNRKKSLSKA